MRLVKYFLVSCVGLIGLWIGINVWPCSLEPALWTEQDLVIPENAAMNGWHALPDKGKVKNGELDDLIPDEWRNLQNFFSFGEEAKKIDSLWAIHPAEFVRGLAEYKKILAYPQFIDVDSFAVGEKKANLFHLMSLHQIGLMEVLRRAVAGNWEPAYSLLANIVKQDESWLFSARSVVSHMIAIRNLKNDLFFLSMMFQQHPPSSRESFDQTVKNLDHSRISFKRAVITEYLFSMNAIDSLLVENMIQEKQPSILGKWYAKIFFNKSVVQRDFNHFFRRQSAFVENADLITDETIRGIDRELHDLTQGRFWWVIHPMSKSLQSLVLTNITGKAREFNQDKKEIEKYKKAYQ